MKRHKQPFNDLVSKYVAIIAETISKKKDLGVALTAAMTEAIQWNKQKRPSCYQNLGIRFCYCMVPLTLSEDSITPYVRISIAYRDHEYGYAIQSHSDKDDKKLGRLLAFRMLMRLPLVLPTPEDGKINKEYIVNHLSRLMINDDINIPNEMDPFVLEGYVDPNTAKVPKEQ